MKASPETVLPGDAAEAGASEESRYSKRHPYVHFVWFHCLESGEEHGLARTVDVSEHGIGLITSRQLAPGARLFIVLVTPFGRVSAIGKVMHAQMLQASTCRVGVKIEVVPPTDKAVWTKLAGRDPR